MEIGEMRRVAIGMAVWWVLTAGAGECAQTGVGAEPAAQAARSKSAAAGWRIAGVVVDAGTGAAVAGAELSIAEENAEMEVTSDENGRFVLAGLEAGKYTVTAKAPGYVEESYNQHGGYSTAMAVGEGLDSEHMVFRLHRQAVISGTVTDEHGEFVRHAQVMLFREDREGGKREIRMAWQMQTDDLGSYRFAHLRAGKYYVAVSARPWWAQTGLRQTPTSGVTVNNGTYTAGAIDAKLDMVYAPTFYPGVTDEHGAGELVVSAGEMQEADVRLQAVPAVHLLVTNMPQGVGANGQPLGAGVSATQKFFGTGFAMGLPTAVGQVGPDGAYEVAGLPPGELTLQINQNSNGEWENRTLHVNARDGESVDAGAAGAGVNVTGKVLLITGNVAQGNVFLTNKNGQTLSRNLQKDGTFTMAVVEAGTYEVNVNLDPTTPDDYLEGIAAHGAKADGTEVKIEATGDVQLTIRMGSGMGQVKGVVKEGGKAEAGAMVLLVPVQRGGDWERHVRVDQSDSDGTFTLGRVVPGKYVLMAIADGWELEWEKEEVLRGLVGKGKEMEVGPHEVKSVEVEEERGSGRVEKKEVE